MKTQSIGEHLRNIRGFTSGFDYLRYGLAIAVVLWHSCLVSLGDQKAMEIADNWSSWFTRPILPMFFALSGFLVASSLERSSSIPKFLWMRATRIYPALTAEVILSAFIIGPIITTLPLTQYFTDPKFQSYMWNMIGRIRFELPGVFATAPMANVVNSSLWTVPFELECYIILAALGLLKLHKQPKILLLLLLAVILSLSAYTIIKPENFLYPKANLTGRQLVIFFVAGVAAYLNRDSIPHSKWLALLCAILGAISLRNIETSYIATIPVTYITVWLGVCQPKKIAIMKKGDYSYGIYLYAWPMQQIAQQSGLGATYVANVLISLTLVSVFAAFSWHFIEKPALKYKNIFDRGLDNRVTT